MIKIINGKRYNTNKCKILGKYHRYNNGNYSGTTYLILASDDILLVHTVSSGQDCYLSDSLISYDDYCCDRSVDDFDIVDDRLEDCIRLKLIVNVE
jgi:hypothetical protein